jgi:hypothetical protein
MCGTPRRSTSCRDTVDFPEPVPPMTATLRTERESPALAPAVGLVLLQQRHVADIASQRSRIIASNWSRGSGTA